MLVVFSSSRAHFPLCYLFLYWFVLKYHFWIRDLYSQFKTVPYVMWVPFELSLTMAPPPNAYFFPIDTPACNSSSKTSRRPFRVGQGAPHPPPIAVHFPDPAIQPEIDPCSNSLLLKCLWDSVYPWGKRTCDSGRREFKTERREDWCRQKWEEKETNHYDKGGNNLQNWLCIANQR